MANKSNETMKLRFKAHKINKLASKYIENEDRDVITLKPAIQKRGYITKQELQTIAKWKSRRSSHHVKKNDELYIKAITRLSLKAKSERTRIEVLTNLDGVSWPTASVILHLYHNDQYPILDFRALWSVSLDMPKFYNYSFWQPYVDFCREIARRNSVDMRTLDRALWQYSKDPKTV